MVSPKENQGEPRPGPSQRRSFFQALGWAGLVALIASAWRRFLVVSPLRDVAIAAPTGEMAEENVALRMHRDLEKALRKPSAERRWGMVIDMRKCIGCHACEVACIAENNLPLASPIGPFGKWNGGISQRFAGFSCPPIAFNVRVLPVWKRPIR